MAMTGQVVSNARAEGRARRCRSRHSTKHSIRRTHGSRASASSRGRRERKPSMNTPEHRPAQRPLSRCCRRSPRSTLASFAARTASAKTSAWTRSRASSSSRASASKLRHRPRRSRTRWTSAPSTTRAPSWSCNAARSAAVRRDGERVSRRRGRDASSSCSRRSRGSWRARCDWDEIDREGVSRRRFARARRASASSGSRSPIEARRRRACRSAACRVVVGDRPRRSLGRDHDRPARGARHARARRARLAASSRREWLPRLASGDVHRIVRGDGGGRRLGPQRGPHHR